MPIYYWLDLLKETRIHTSFDEMLLLKNYNDIIAIECCDIILTSLIKLPQNLNLLISYFFIIKKNNNILKILIYIKSFLCLFIYSILNFTYN